MKRALLPALLALLACAAAASAADPAGGGFSTKSFGEGGGYKHPDPATGEYLEDSARQDASADAKPVPDPAPVAATPAPAPSPAPVRAPSPVAMPRRAAASAAARDIPASQSSQPRSPDRGSSPGVSLWSGLVKPVETPAAAADANDPDSASEQGRLDYEARVLGQSGPARPRLDQTSIPQTAQAPEAQSAAPAITENRLFVSLELDPKESGSLRDAVAGLGASVGFAADARFQPISGPAGTSFINGWIPASQLGTAALQPGVRKIRVETSRRPSPAREISGEFLVGLRLEDPSRARQAIDAGVGALASTAGFRLTRVIGVETAPDGRAVAVIAGSLPLSRLAKAMGRSDVVKITPVSVSLEAAQPAGETPSRTRSFARFMMDRALWLVLLTLILSLSSLRRVLGRALQVFVPYR